MSENGVQASHAHEQTGGTPHQPLHALREVREASGLHIAALAAALKVPVRKLEALEAGRYEELPDLTFARALASSACRHLKTDPKPVLDQIPMRQAPALGAPPSAIGAPFKPSVPGSTNASPSWMGRPSVIVAGALVLGAVALLLLPEWESFYRAQTANAPVVEQPVTAAPPEPAFAPPAPATGTSETAGGQPEPVPAAIPATETDEPVGNPPVQNAGNAAVPPVNAADPAAGSPTASSGVALASAGSAEQPGASGASGAILYIEATGESWVEVTNATGAVVTQRLLKPGDVIEFSSAPPYKVILGRAEAAKVLVRGQPFDVLPYARNSVARFEAR